MSSNLIFRRYFAPLSYLSLSQKASDLLTRWSRATEVEDPAQRDNPECLSRNLCLHGVLPVGTSEPELATGGYSNLPKIEHFLLKIMQTCLGSQPRAAGVEDYRVRVPCNL